MSGFDDYLVASGLAPGTIRNYLWRKRQIDEWCVKAGVDLKHATAPQLAALGASFKRDHTTLSQVRATLAKWYEYQDRWDAPLKALRVPTAPNRPNRALSREDARLLHKAARYRPPEGTAVLMGMYMGLRVTEIASAEWSRFDEHMEWYQCLGKGSKTRYLPVHPMLRQDLAYLKRDSEWLFPGRKGLRDHVTPATVWRWCKDVAELAGIRKITTHQLRHLAITEVYDRTGDLRAAQHFAGHSDPRVTAGYTRLNVMRLTNAVHAIDYEEDDA